MSFFQTSKNLKLENEVGDLQKAHLIVAIKLFLDRPLKINIFDK